MVNLEFRLILEERRQEWERRLATMQAEGAPSHKTSVIEEVIAAYHLVLAEEES